MINKKKFGKIIKQKWHVQGFNACMNYIFHAAYSGLIDCHAEVGYGYTQKLWIFKKDYVEYHYLENDFKNVGQEFMKKYQQNKKYLKKLLDKESIRVREAMDLLVFVDKQKLSRLNKQELIDLYQKLWGVYHRLVGD